MALCRTKLHKGKRSAWVRVNSSRRSEKIVVRVGKRSYVRRVGTNKLVKVASLTIPKGVSISVTLAS